MNEPDTETKVALLKRPEVYGGQVCRVDAIETHMAWVFLTDNEAYKLKKPIRDEFLDYSTMEARRTNCEEEVRLNRRLAPSVYLGVVELVVGRDGELQIGAPGRVVDYLVRMRRLASSRLLNKAIVTGTAALADVSAIADLLVGFYSDAEPVLPAENEFLGRFTRDLQLSLAELMFPAYQLPRASVLLVHSALSSFLLDRRPMFEARVGARRILEGHGDMRAEHVFLGPPPSIIDCLEFNRGLRIVDWVEEVSFLAVDCERLGAAWVGPEIIGRCCSGLSDRPPPMLIDFYKSLHALSRARIAIRHLRDGQTRAPERWLPLARRYLDLALRYLPSRGC